MKSTISFDDFTKIDMRVGKVVDATNKEGSEKLIRLVVDFGEKSTGGTKGTGSTGSEEENHEIRIIFTGVRGFGYTTEDFLGKQFFFVTNLAPRKMLDEESQGMILAVDGLDKKPVFVAADGMPIGVKIR